MAVKNNYISVAYQLYVKDGESEKEELAEECSFKTSLYVYQQTWCCARTV